MNGTFVQSRDGKVLQLVDAQHEFRWPYSPVGGLPEGSFFVVRTAALEEFQDRCGIVPTVEAESAGATPPASSTRHLVAATWQDVAIFFISDHRVQITVQDQTYPQNYAEMGFSDLKTGNPKKAWDTLLALAKAKGVLSVAPRGDWTKIEKRMQEIRRTLRSHFLEKDFDIPPQSDPLPFSKGSGNGYRARFTIGVHPSFDT